MAYIDKELFKKDIKMRYCNNCARPNEIKCRACHVDDMLGEIEDAPTADVVEVKHGEWKMEYHETRSTRGRLIRNKTFTCSNCNRRNGRITTNYCSNCGAKMDAERKEGD